MLSIILVALYLMPGLLICMLGLSQAIRLSPKIPLHSSLIFEGLSSLQGNPIRWGEIWTLKYKIIWGICMPLRVE